MPAVQPLAAAALTVRSRPADVVTAVRAVLAAVVAVLVVAGLAGGEQVTGTVVLATVALALDWVDGQVARRTGTTSPFGARFDMEVDAFLIAVLSVGVAAEVGAWVLLIGAARYALLAAERLVPWLRRPTPPRRWSKVVAALQGIALTVAVSGALPRPATVLLLAVALALLAESFGRQVWWLWRSRDGAEVEGRFESPVTLLALVLLWLGLTLPDRVEDLGTPWFARLPLELLVLVVLAVVLPARARDALAWAVGAAMALVLIGRTLDMGFYLALDRSFDPVVDWTYAGSLLGLLRDSLGTPLAVLVLALAVAAFGALLVLCPLALRRLGRVVARHRRVSLRSVTVLGVVWVVVAMLGLGFRLPSLHHATYDGTAPLASSVAAQYAYAQVARVPAELRDQRAFAQAAAHDPLRSTPAGDLLARLRGKDVLFVFVESYGRSAVQGSSSAPGVDAVLDKGTHSLRARGFGSRSAFLTSPTFGGLSWLAHSTLQSGVWVDSQRRYDVLVTSRRLTLSRLFGRAGWRTVADVPANTHAWPQGRFYGYDRVYDARDVGYHGPPFGYPTMPDQYTLEAFHRLELAPRHRQPVMAEIDLLSSHAPWSRTPHLVPQAAVGDGSVYDGMPDRLPSKTVVWRSRASVRAAYAQSIEYSLRALLSFVEHHGDKDLVLVVLGDHQPATVVSGTGAGHDVPVSVIARDPAVLAPFARWGWQPGLHPGPDAPVARMDSFRDRFVAAFGR